MRLQRLALFSMLFACVLRTAAAQERDLFGMFGDAVRSGMAAAVQADWERLPDPEVACVDRALQQKGSSINDVIRQGISPADPRMAGLRSACRQEDRAAGAPLRSPFTVDGFRLDGQVAVGSPAYLEYQCSPSTQFVGLTSCQRRRSENSPRGPYQSTDTVLHGADGTAFYIDRLLAPTYLSTREAMNEIRRLAISYGEPRLMPAPRMAGVPRTVMAYWGDVVLEALDSAQRDDLAAGRDVHAGLLIDHLGDIKQSAMLGLPVYRLTGGPGYVAAASWDRTGRGALRFLAVDASRLPAPVVEPAGGNADASAAAVTPNPNAAAGLPPQPTASPTPVPSPPAAAPAAAPLAAAPPQPNPQQAKPQQPKPENKDETPAQPRMVGPPLVNRTVTADPNAAGHGNGFGWASVGLASLLLAAAGYLLLKRRQRSRPPSAMFNAPAMRADRQAKVIVDDAPRGPLADVKHDPAHEVTIEPVSMTEAVTAPVADTAGSVSAAKTETAETVSRPSRTASA